MKSPPVGSTTRIDLIDAMRGSALLGIILLHAIGHWSLPGYPADSAAWLKTLDAWTVRLGLFLFEGKAYAIFSLMFGVSFFLILDRWARHGVNLHGRFLWRLAVLAVFGYLHGIIYGGDILLTIAVLGVPLMLLHRLGNRTLAWIAAALLLQIPVLWETVRLLLDHGYQPTQPHPWVAEGDIFKVYAHGSFLDVSAVNAWNGQAARVWWAIESGRYGQMLGLFVCGLLVGRCSDFEDPARCAGAARRVLLWGLVGFVVLYAVRLRLGAWGLTDPARSHAGNLLSAYRDLAQSAVWMGAFVLLYQWSRARMALNLLAPYGRMSLTCYVMQGLIGVPLFYGYGLALHRHLGPFTSLLLGGAIFAAQCVCAHFWLRRFHYGPLEWLWRSCTFLDFATPMRKPAGMGTAAALAPAQAMRCRDH